MYARQSLGLRSNTKARSAAVHYKQLFAVGPEKLHTVGTKQKHGDTETYKALPQSHLQCSQAKYHQIQFGGAKPDDLHDSLSFSTKAHFQTFTKLPYAK